MVSYSRSLSNRADQIKLKSVLLNSKEKQTTLDWGTTCFRMLIGQKIGNLPTESCFSVFHLWEVDHTLETPYHACFSALFIFIWTLTAYITRFQFLVLLKTSPKQIWVSKYVSMLVYFSLKLGIKALVAWSQHEALILCINEMHRYAHISYK